MGGSVSQTVFCWVLGLGCFFVTPFKAGRYWTWSGGRGGRGGFVTILITSCGGKPNFGVSLHRSYWGKKGGTSITPKIIHEKASFSTYVFRYICYPFSSAYMSVKITRFWVLAGRNFHFLTNITKNYKSFKNSVPLLAICPIFYFLLISKFFNQSWDWFSVQTFLQIFFSINLPVIGRPQFHSICGLTDFWKSKLNPLQWSNSPIWRVWKKSSPMSSWLSGSPWLYLVSWILCSGLSVS